MNVDMEGGLGQLIPFLTNPEKFIENLARKKEMMKNAQLYIYKFIDEHFREKKNSDGSAWAPLAENTLVIREKRFSRLGYGKAHRYSRRSYGLLPLMGSSQYSKDLSQSSSSTLHKVHTTTKPMLAQVATNLPQSINEYDRVNQSKYFKGAKVPKREVLFFSHKNIEELIGYTETLLFEGVLEEFDEK